LFPLSLDRLKIYIDGPPPLGRGQKVSRPWEKEIHRGVEEKRYKQGGGEREQKREIIKFDKKMRKEIRKSREQ
jgi:hypothetical protein